MELIRIACSVADYIFSQREAFRVRDIMLYGSQARGTATKDSDIDLLIIHYNTGLERMQLRRNEPASDNIERFNRIESELAREGCPGLHPLLSIDGILEAINANLLNTEFLHEDFFQNPDHLRRVIDAQIDHLFFQSIFKEGLLYNTATCCFDVPASSKYTVETSPITFIK